MWCSIPLGKYLEAKVPSKVSFFLWVASIGNILTVENLRKHNIILVSWVLHV